MADLVEAAVLGLSLGLQFNPLTSVLSAPVVAALAVGSSRKHSLLGLPGALLLLAWAIGDGRRLLAVAIADGSLAPVSAASDRLAAYFLWALVGLGLGYLLPAWAGAFVGRRVTWGTGWLSGAVVAFVAAVALVTLTSPL